MSDLLYSEVPNYYKGQYKEYSVYNDKEIKGFFGEYRWLSNFWDCSIWFEGIHYLNSESAYQAAKIVAKERNLFAFCSASKAKKIWKNLPLLYTQKEWDAIKYNVMASIIFEKFCRNIDLREKLVDTGNKYLEETNNWHDNFWGHCICEKCKNEEKLNNLGKILEKTRSFWA